VGYNKGTFGTIVFVFVIFAHVWASKLDLVRKRKHVAPILMYVTQGLGVVLMVLLVTEVSANDIKKAYPTMKEDAKAARLEYQELRRSK
jgi:glycerol uptake facilitator-like aquaporin